MIMFVKLFVVVLVVSTLLERRLGSVYDRDDFEELLYTIHDVTLVSVVQLLLLM